MIQINERTLKVGDVIKCNDKNDMAEMTQELGSHGVYTDFIYEKDGQPGYWLVVEGIRFNAKQ